MGKTVEVDVKVKGPLGLKLAPHDQGTFVLSAGPDKKAAAGLLFASVTRPTGEVVHLLGKGPPDVAKAIGGSGLPYKLTFKEPLATALDLFMEENEEEINAKFGDLDSSAMEKSVKEMWDKLSRPEKKQYQDRASGKPAKGAAPESATKKKQMQPKMKVPLKKPNKKTPPTKAMTPKKSSPKKAAVSEKKAVEYPSVYRDNLQTCAELVGPMGTQAPAAVRLSAQAQEAHKEWSQLYNSVELQSAQRKIQKASVNAKQRATLSCNHSDAEGKKFAEQLNSLLSSAQLEMIGLRKRSKAMAKDLTKAGHKVSKEKKRTPTEERNFVEDCADERLRQEALSELAGNIAEAHCDKMKEEAVKSFCSLIKNHLSELEIEKARLTKAVSSSEGSSPLTA